MGRIMMMGLVLLLLSCQTLKPPTQTITGLKLTSLEALDLSENASRRLSTQNDEIFLMIHLLEKVNEKNILVQEYMKDDLVFDTITTSVKFTEDFSISNKENQYLAITLVELDEENSSEKVQEITRTILENHDLSKRINRLDYNDNFRDDDLLGLEIIPLKNCCKSNRLIRVLDGVSLLDKYAYRIGFDVLR